MPPTAFTVESPESRRHAVRELTSLLSTGMLVALPMETLYGIAALLTASPAMQRLKQIKNISGHPGWVIHLAEPGHIARYIQSVPTIASRIIKKSWPGPVALQLRASAEDQAALEKLLGTPTAAETIHNGFITFRCPDHALTLEILGNLSGPAVLVGAGEHHPVGAVEDIPTHVAAALSGILDAGPARYHQASTMVRVDGDQFAVVRPGVIDARIINRLADTVIVFICTGNTCRSPMAAGIATKLLSHRLGVPPAALPQHHLVVESAGLHASEGMAATPEARTAAREVGADLSTHRSHPVGQDLLRRADIIYTMTGEHRNEVVERYPPARDKTFTLDPDADIEDPIGSDVNRYRALAQRLESLIVQRLNGILP